jgi:hypothetical protein
MKYSLYIDNRDDKFSRIAFFALRNIEIGEALEFDYNYKVKDNLPCFCGKFQTKM